MSQKVREEKYYECDGCGYVINDASNMTTLELTYWIPDKTPVSPSGSPGMRGKIPLHFHPVSEEQDCLRYFVLGFGVAKHQLKDHYNLPEKARELILSKVPLQAKSS